MRAIEACNARFVSEPLRRQTARCLYEGAHTVLIETRPNALMLYTDDPEDGKRVLAAQQTCDLFTTNDRAIVEYAKARFALGHCNPCYFVVYEKSEPPVTPHLLDLRPPDDRAMQLIRENYDLADEEELAIVRERGDLICGYADGALAGFIGRHLEGSLGMLFIFPEFRRRGFAEELEGAAIARCLGKGDIAYADIIMTNAASLALQKKLGFTVREDMQSFWVF